jgi:hypothetical protein
MANLRYDDVVHELSDDNEPLCDQAMISACAPEVTNDPVNCIWCESITS